MYAICKTIAYLYGCCCFITAFPITCHTYIYTYFLQICFLINYKFFYMYSQVTNNLSLPGRFFFKFPLPLKKENLFRPPPFPPPPSAPSFLIINFVISKSLFQNFASISIKTYVKLLKKLKILIKKF